MKLVMLAKVACIGANDDQHQILPCARAAKLSAGLGLWCRAVLSAAGSYVVKVTIGGKMVPGWPQPLHVVPGAAVAAKSWLTGASLEVP